MITENVQKINHSDMVRRLAKPGKEIRVNLHKDDVNALNAALSLQDMISTIFTYRFEGSQMTAYIFEEDDVAHLYHMLVGMAGEVGEMIDCIKKKVIYKKELDITNLIEELGDFEFYLEGYNQGETQFPEFTDIRQRLEVIYGIYGLTKDQALEANINKLSKRYRDLTYSDQQAHERADKVEPAKSLIDNDKV